MYRASAPHRADCLASLGRVNHVDEARYLPGEIKVARAPRGFCQVLSLRAPAR